MGMSGCEVLQQRCVNRCYLFVSVFTGHCCNGLESRQASQFYDYAFMPYSRFLSLSLSLSLSVIDWSGLAQCAELCWQLRGEAEQRQVPGAKVALQHNIGLGGAVVVTLYRMGFSQETRSVLTLTLTLSATQLPKG